MHLWIVVFPLFLDTGLLLIQPILYIHCSVRLFLLSRINYALIIYRICLSFWLSYFLKSAQKCIIVWAASTAVAVVLQAAVAAAEFAAVAPAAVAAVLGSSNENYIILKKTSTPGSDGSQQDSRRIWQSLTTWLCRHTRTGHTGREREKIGYKNISASKNRLIQKQMQCTLVNSSIRKKVYPEQ